MLDRFVPDLFAASSWFSYIGLFKKPTKGCLCVCGFRVGLTFIPGWSVLGFQVFCGVYCVLSCFI